MTTCGKCHCLLEKGHAYVDPQFEKSVRVYGGYSGEKTKKKDWQLTDDDFIKFGEPRCRKHKTYEQVRLDNLMIDRKIKADLDHQEAIKFFSVMGQAIELGLTHRKTLLME